MTTSIVDTEPTKRVKAREISFEWELGPTTNHYDEPGDLVAVLDIYHHGDRKCFTAHVRNHTRIGNIVSISLYDSVRIAVRPVARFSAKAMEAFAADALAELRARKDEPAIAKYLVNPSAAEQAA